MATVTSGGGSGCHWKNHRIVFVDIPINHFLLVCYFVEWDRIYDHTDDCCVLVLWKSIILRKCFCHPSGTSVVLNRTNPTALVRRQRQSPW